MTIDLVTIPVIFSMCPPPTPYQFLKTKLTPGYTNMIGRHMWLAIKWNKFGISFFDIGFCVVVAMGVRVLCFSNMNTLTNDSLVTTVCFSGVYFYKTAATFRYVCLKIFAHNLKYLITIWPFCHVLFAGATKRSKDFGFCANKTIRCIFCY